MSDCVIILDRPKTPDNVGTILRSTLALAGPNTTVAIAEPRWPLFIHPINRLRTDPSSAHKHLNVRTFAHLTDALDAVATSTDMSRVVIERGVFRPPEYLDEFEHPERAVYIFGPEDGSVPDEPWLGPHLTVEIRGAATLASPVQGCLNLATAVSIVLYDRLAKMTRASSEKQSEIRP